MNRRQFFSWLGRLAKAAAAGVVGLAGARWLRAGLLDAEAAPPAQRPLRPPGALPEAQFRAACTRCLLCGEVCSAICIAFPSRIEGAQPPLRRAPGAMERQELEAPVWRGGATPYVLPWKRACELCMRCGEVCPTGALRPIAADRQTIAREVRMGVALIDRKVCLPWTRTSWCGACRTACPYRGRAITVDHQGRPTVHPEHCVGCGLCVEVCPLRYKAIAVDPPFSPDRGSLRAE